MPGSHVTIMMVTLFASDCHHSRLAGVLDLLDLGSFASDDFIDHAAWLVIALSRMTRHPQAHLERSIVNLVPSFVTHPQQPLLVPWSLPLKSLRA